MHRIVRFDPFQMDMSFLERKEKCPGSPAIHETNDRLDLLNKINMLENELNKCRYQLQSFPSNKWHEHTSRTNLYGNVVRILRKEMKIEMCTNAFVKCYELLTYYNLISPNNHKHLKTLHLAEAPGGFISAFNHYLHQKNSSGDKISWEWWGNSLNPKCIINQDEGLWMIQDDRLIKATESHWIFGENKTGNLLDIETILSIEKQHANKMDIITCDGSISNENVWNNQEENVFPLLLSEVICSLCCLKAQGHLILKIFTHFHSNTMKLILILLGHFDDVWMHKPYTSKSGNSEVYLIAKSFHGLSYPFRCYLFNLFQLKKITSMNQNFYKMFSSMHIPLYQLKQFHLSCEYFTHLNIQAIENNIQLYYQHQYQDIYRLNKIWYHQRQQKALELIDTLGIQPIDWMNRLVIYKYLDGSGDNNKKRNDVENKK